MILNGKILLGGKGLHSGRECELTIEPCDSPTILLSSGVNELPVSELALCGTNRGSDYTFPGPDGTTIRTCEHVFSALYGMGIYSGVRVTVKGGEMPALDGCSRTVCDELLKHSSQAQAKTDILTLKSPVIVYGTDPTRYIAAFPYDRLRITCIVEYDYIGSQVYPAPGGRVGGAGRGQGRKEEVKRPSVTFLGMYKVVKELVTVYNYITLFRK